MKEDKKIKFKKEASYIINGRSGQYELTTLKGELCFFMDDTLKYEYFENPKVELFKDC